MTTFTPNCTLPDGVFNYVASPNTRGTLQILWSSLSALFLCTWTVQHLNVPVQVVRRTGLKEWFLRLLRFEAKLKMMGITLLTPELLLGKAYSDHRSARGHLAQFKEIAAEDNVDWALAHCFLANMGGFALTFEDRTSFRSDFSSGTADTDDESRVTDGISNLSRAQTAPMSGRGNMDNPTISTKRRLSSIKASKGLELQNTSTPGGHEPAETVWSETCPFKIKPIREGAPSDEEKLRSLEPEIRESFNAKRDDHTNSFTSRVQDERGGSRLTGELKWASDEQNEAKVKEALESPQLQYFRTNWEREGYLLRYTDWYFNLLALRGEIWYLDACQLLLARKMKIIERLPDVSRDDIDVRNKGDVFVKGLAAAQVIWLFLQVIARGAGRLPPSQLEVVVLAFAVCTIVIYGLLWEKPQDVKTPVRVKALRRPSMEELTRLAVNGPFLYPSERKDYAIPDTVYHCDGGPVVGTDRIIAGALVGAFMFGGLHCAAWNLQFPTLIEQLLWRIAAVVTAGVPCLWAFLGWVIRALARSGFKKKAQSTETLDKVFGWFMLGCSIPYIVARLYITVEIFRSLCYLPPQTFSVDWTKNLPHIG